MSKNKITILYGLPDTNAGGSALGISLCQVLKAHFPHCKINYISSHSDKSHLLDAYPYLREKCPDVDILPFPLSARSENWKSGRYMRKLKSILWGIKILFSPIFILFPFLTKNKTLQEIKESAIIIGRGTQIFYDKKAFPIRSLLSQYWLCFPLLMAWRYGKNYIIYGQSFHPIYNPMIRWLHKFTFDRAILILPREKPSANYLIETLEIPAKQVKLIPDSVFALSSPRVEFIRKTCDKYALPYKKYLVLVIREFMTPKNNIRNMFPAFKKACEQLFAKKIIEKCVIVTQCHHFPQYQGFESDSKISKQLFEFLQPGKNPIELIDKALSPDMLINLYGGARFLVSVRLHAAIFALLASTPAIAISYWGFKTYGIMRMLDLENRVIDIKEEFNSNIILNKLEEIEEHYQGEVTKITTEIEKMHKQANKTPLLFKEFFQNQYKE